MSQPARSNSRKFSKLSREVIGAAITVHRELGPGLLEAVYQECLEYELELRGIEYEREFSMPVTYKDVEIDCGYRVDFLVEGELLVETKAVRRVTDLHRAQLLSYLKLSNIDVGFLVNFHRRLLKKGLHRMVYDRARRRTG